MAINKGTPRDIALQGLNDPDDILSVALQGFLETDLAIFGDINLGGQATFVFSRKFVSAGGEIVLDGGAGIEVTFTHNSTGDIITGGAGSSRRIFDHQSTGLITLGGEATIVIDIAPSDPADIIVSGSASVSITRNVSSSGNIDVGGSSGVSRTFTHISTGLITVGGDAIEEFIPEDFTHTSTGLIIMGGCATVVFESAAVTPRPGGAGSMAAQAYALSVRMHDEQIYLDYIERLEQARERQKKKFARIHSHKSTGGVKVSGTGASSVVRTHTEDYLIDYTECNSVEDIILAEDAMLLSEDLVGGVYKDGVVRHTPIDVVVKVQKRRAAIDNIIYLEDIELVSGEVVSQDDKDENELYELDLVS
jgi:hypothetical protein